MIQFTSGGICIGLAYKKARLFLVVLQCKVVILPKKSIILLNLLGILANFYANQSNSNQKLLLVAGANTARFAHPCSRNQALPQQHRMRTMVVRRWFGEEFSKEDRPRRRLARAAATDYSAASGNWSVSGSGV
ncbi:hypothetical protein LZK82_27070 (plasmid) [Rhizobium leguminosarum]|uniref:hypothetical protein n=1 Tax=Rhizobium leguminosarum TaxID=384 RepID=UPI0012BD77D6|nr:hypothetical protein [Rhizobium leguminosarum]UIK01178.1 hypothetical protein LZK82_27070 [Rhizobium leguminosarum]UIL30228.1 hypothetical protein LZK75_27410 [Rhizobium leguminosarum]WFT90862.1 hypothetical protein QA638_35770 [Rhizobium leguminosarum]